MTYSLRIVDMAESDRPRERLLSQGVRSLSNAELIAILLGQVRAQENSPQLAWVN